MPYTDEIFGLLDNQREVHRITLTNENNTGISFLNYGLIIQSIIFDNQDIVLGYDNLAQYEENYPMFGATCGRVINRTSNACFELDGKTYFLVANRGKHNIHTDKNHGFHKVLWDYQVFEDSSVRFHYFSPDGDCGFPAGVDMYITYTLTDNDTLIASYEGDPDDDTVLNPSNHTYFNLDGQDAGNLDDHLFCICADSFTPIDSECIPTGEIRSVEKTDMDLTTFHCFRDLKNSHEPQLQCHHGFDHNYALNRCNFGIRKAATARGNASGIEMTIFTDLPGLQFYTGQSLRDEYGKNGMVYQSYAGFCMEPQYFPNAMNTADFEKPVFSANHPYTANMIYLFRKYKSSNL